MPKNKSYNIDSLRGIQIDDMEYVEKFDLDPEVAYTPKINDVMLDKMYNENIKGHMNNGDDLAMAKSKAGVVRARLKSEINQLMKGKVPHGYGT